MITLPFRHVDVFADAPLTGNGLTAFFTGGAEDGEFLQRVTQEMRQFESIFLAPAGADGVVPARIYTMEEELAFAGHPLLGAAAVLHERDAPQAVEHVVRLRLRERVVTIESRRADAGYRADMDQGRAAFGATLDSAAAAPFLAALNLAAADAHPALPLAVVSTGLPYLIVPVQIGLERARIVHADFERLLASIGAQFAYVLDVAAREGRTWDNAGRVEDIATGSAAGPAGAYLVRHGQAPAAAWFTLQQGQYVGRPSRLHVRVSTDDGVRVAGNVAMVGRGVLEF